MEDQQLKNLCVDLVKADTTKEVKKILSRYNLWDNLDYWAPLGENESNWPVIGVQSTESDRALVEKIVNSTDSILINECKIKGIDPESTMAPETVKKAMIDLIGISRGSFEETNSEKLKELENKLGVVVSGLSRNEGNGSYTIYDKGEGQAPEDFKNTFTQITNSNKNKIPFVQGKFGMGGLGVLRFVNEGLQLIISRKNPSIKGLYSDKIGFTITRKFPISEGEKNHVFRYLKINGGIPSFNFEPLQILPAKINGLVQNYVKNWEFGAYIKLYEYDSNLSKSVGDSKLGYRLSMLIPEPVVPIQLWDVRSPNKQETGFYNWSTKGFIQESKTKYRKEQLENNGKPIGGAFSINEQKIKVRIYVLKYKFKNNRGNVREPRIESWHGNQNSSIVFTLNGQANGYLSSSFYTSKRVGLSQIKDKIITVVDCSEMNNESISLFFNNNREQIVKNDFSESIKKKLEEILKNDTKLKEIKDSHRVEKYKDSQTIDKPIEKMLSKIIEKHNILSKIFNKKGKITDPFGNRPNLNGQNKIKLQKFPTFFKIEKKDNQFTKTNPRNIQETKNIRIKFLTDASDDYITRDEDEGNYNLYINDEKSNQVPYFSGKNGKWTLEIGEHNFKLDSLNKLNINIGDRTQSDKFEEFKNELWVKTNKDQDATQSKTKSKSRKFDGEGTGGNIPASLDIPEVNIITKAQWDTHEFTEKSGLYVDYNDSENQFVININMDNVYLKNFIHQDSSNAEIIKGKYVNVMTIIGLSFALEYQKSLDNEKSEFENENDLEKQSRIFSDIISLWALPILDVGEYE